MQNKTRKLLEKHFDTAFAAPDGVKRLRELILTLAMQGKLVPQDPEDQPASELLKEIEAVKQRLIKAGNIKKPKPLPEIKPEEVPYELPESWEWVRLGNIGVINPRNLFDDEKDAGFIPMPLIYAEYGAPHKFETKKWGEIKKGYTHFADDDVAIAKITPCFENGKSCVFSGLPNEIGAETTELHVFRNAFNAIYSKYALSISQKSEIHLFWHIQNDGFCRPEACPNHFFFTESISSPPLAEQYRIAAKIDQLMARCDALEKQNDAATGKQTALLDAVMAQV